MISEYEEFMRLTLGVFKLVFTNAEIYSSCGQNWIEFRVNNKVYGVRFIDNPLFNSIKSNYSHIKAAEDMLKEAVAHVARSEQ